MLYAIWTHAFHLPDANPNQFSFDTYSDKRELIKGVLQMISDSRETIIDLDGEEMDELLDEVLEELHSLLEEPNLEGMDLTNKYWEFGNMELNIHMADYYPAVVRRFPDVTLKIAEDVFSDYTDLDDEDEKESDNEVDYDDDYDDDEYLSLYRQICSINESTALEEFDQVFGSCKELLSEWSTF